MYLFKLISFLISEGAINYTGLKLNQNRNFSSELTLTRCDMEKDPFSPTDNKTFEEQKTVTQWCLDVDEREKKFVMFE